MRIFLTFLIVYIFCFSISIHSQNNYIPSKTGYINFTLNSNSLKKNSSQAIHLYGCNTSFTIDSAAVFNPENKFYKKQALHWNTKNQVVNNIPFGHQKDTINGKDFYVSKYYIASPPVVNKSAGIFDIGLITPDEFTFKGDKPSQMVYLDYNILKKMKIEYFPINYSKSFDKLNINLVPFKVECKDFPWTNKKNIKNAKGASGIGALNRKKNIDSLFLPYYFDKKKNKKILDCKVTILNDILLDHKILFVHPDGKKSETINLKDYYNSNYKSTKIKLKAFKRRKQPCGCVER